MRTVTKHYCDFARKDGTTVALELPFPMSPIMEYKELLYKTGDDRIIIGYLADDSDVADPCQDDAYMGHIYSCQRRSSTLKDYEQALGLRDGGPDLGLTDDLPGTNDDDTPEERLDLWRAARKAGTIGNRYAVLLDVYEHGMVHYLVNSGGQQDFDVARCGAVWVPSEELKAELDELHNAYQPWTERALELAAQAAATYTDWCNGNCFGIVVAEYDNEGGFVGHETCWGHIGDDDAYAALQDNFPTEEK